MSKMGPSGGSAGSARQMNVGVVNRIKAIDAIRIMFERNGQPERTPMWGGSGGGFNEAISKMGPSGGSGGGAREMNVDGVSRINKLIVRHGGAIDAIRIMFERNGQPEWTPMWGGSGGGFTEINLGPDEHLISVEGHYGKFQDWLLIRSLTFVSNRHTYGPYGRQEGTSFSLPADNGQIVGFHVRSGKYIDAIGTYVRRP
ncbi:agglutinin alpha chain-like [Typha angustifolia]|uniref:agglutinin alpha chain-like n=1 Tax=Typha angustifolia TaxID=59011 RepID=UPI003C2C9811